MAVKTFVPERVQWSMAPSFDMTVVHDTTLDVSQIVVPYNVAHYLLDDYRIRNGWPVAVPKFDIRCKSLTSVTGDVVSYRPSPGGLTTAADVRWIPTELTWNDTDFTLRPEDSPYTNFVWQSSVGFAPTYLNNYTYRVGKEIITRNGLNFNADQKEHLWSNFSGGFSGTTGYTMLMVLSLSSRFGLDGEVQDYSGLLCSGHPTPGGDTFAETITGNDTNLQLRGRYLYANGGEVSGFQQMFPINLALTRTQPSYLAITVDPPYTKVYMGFGAPGMQKAQFSSGAPQGSALDWVLGRATGDVLHCADMTVFDLNLYANPLSDTELLGEVALLSQAYGG